MCSGLFAKEFFGCIYGAFGGLAHSFNVFLGSFHLLLAFLNLFVDSCLGVFYSGLAFFHFGIGSIYGFLSLSHSFYGSLHRGASGYSFEGLRGKRCG